MSETPWLWYFSAASRFVARRRARAPKRTTHSLWFAALVPHSVDNAQDGHLKRFGILTLFAAQEPKSNEFVDFRYV